MLPPLLVLGPIRLCLSDICSLGSLISTTKQEERRWTALRIVHTVARAVVNPQFPDTTSQDGSPALYTLPASTAATTPGHLTGGLETG
jgi:hypothetical protein